MIDIASHVRSGDTVWWSQAAAEPTPLVDALVDAVPRLGQITAFVGLCWNPLITRDPPTDLRLQSYGALGDLRLLPAERLDILRLSMFELVESFSSGAPQLDVGLVQASPPDADGRCTLALGSDYAWDAAHLTPTLLAEINDRVPASDGPWLPFERFAASLQTSRTLVEFPERPPRPVDAVIAEHVASLIADGDTLQLGVGQIPSAVLEQLSGHTDLGIHSGVITEPLQALVESGAVNGARKEIDRGYVVTGTAMGTTEFYSRIATAPFRFRPTSYTHDPKTLEQLRSLVAVNSAVAVSLGGDVNAELRGNQLVGAIGGQADFARAAHTSGSLSIIALPSTSGGRSTITPRVGRVSTPSAHVDVVVTEHGIAHLTGCSPEGRARRLIAIAAPEHRESLEQSLSFPSTEPAPDLLTATLSGRTRT